MGPETVIVKGTTPPFGIVRQKIDWWWGIGDSRRSNGGQKIKKGEVTGGELNESWMQQQLSLKRRYDV